MKSCSTRGILTRSVAAVASLGLLFGAAGCGTDGDYNDQGVTFTNLGYFEDSSGASGVTGLSIPLSQGTAQEPANFGGSPSAAVGVYNGLINQYIRVENIFLSYRIPGATRQPPSTNVAISGIVGSAQAVDGIDPAIPPGFGPVGQAGNPLFAEFSVVPPEVYQWLSLNRASLPEPPFTMIVNGFVRGTSTSGNVYETNDADLTIIVTPDNDITPTEGGGGVGGGADPDGLENEEVVDF